MASTRHYRRVAEKGSRIILTLLGQQVVEVARRMLRDAPGIGDLAAIGG